VSHVRSQDEIEAEVRIQRERLADTVDQLAAKLDVMARARDRVTALRDAATTDTGRPRPAALAVACALAAALAVVLWRRRH